MLTLYVYWFHLSRTGQKIVTGRRWGRGPWPGGIRGGYLNPLYTIFETPEPKGSADSLRSAVTADP